MAIARKYKGKDAEMLICAASITQAAIAHKATLIPKKPTWADPFFPRFMERINNAISNYLGLDNAANLRAQTHTVNSIFKTAYANISLVKLNIEQDFKSDPDRRNEILNTLGYNLYWRAAQQKDQEALISLLFAFKQNLSDPLQSELIAKGNLPLTLTQIIDAAQTLMDANITQETIKQFRKQQSEAKTNEFNSIYDELISICILATRFLSHLPATRHQFSYSKALKALNTNATTTRFDQQKTIQPSSTFTLSKISLTYRTRIYLTLLTPSDQVFACLNSIGCPPDQSQKLPFLTKIELTKATLHGKGKHLNISNLGTEDVNIQITIKS